MKTFIAKKGKERRRGDPESNPYKPCELPQGARRIQNNEKEGKKKKDGVSDILELSG